MMTSVGGNRARGNWEQTQSQTQHKQRPQATAEQIRLAQMISDHNDADFEEKVKQLVDITGKDQDESMIALHDCNGDVNRAINVLLEGSPDTDSWEMVGKKKSLSGQKEQSQADTGEDGKENRDKGPERDVARRRGGAPRRGRGSSRGREFRGQENGLDGSKVAGIAGRGTERGRRGRGRGRGGMAPSSLALGCLEGGEAGSLRKAWGPELTPAEASNYQPKFDSAPGPWKQATEEWGTEDWNEDLSETKIFTASSVAAATAATTAATPLPQENVTITKGQRIDLAVLLGKTPPSASSEAPPPMEAGPPASLSQSLVFSNSKQGVPLSPAASGATYSQHSMVNMLAKGFGDVGGPKGGSAGTTTGSQFLEQYKTAQALAQLAAQHSQVAPPNASPSSWNTGASALDQYDVKPESTAHGPFTKRQPYQATATTSAMLDAFLPGAPSPHTVPPPASSLPKMTAPHHPPATSASSSLGGQQQQQHQQVSPGSSDTQGSSPLPLQQHKLKQQRKRASITTKFGSEPVLPEYDTSPHPNAATTAANVPSSNQVQNSLYSSPSSEAAPGLPSPGQMEMYEQRAAQTRRYPASVSSSPQKDLQPKNGFHSMQSGQSGEAVAGSAASGKPVADPLASASVSSMGTLTDGGPGPASLLTAANQMAHAAHGHNEELPQSTISQPQHNNSLSSQQSNLPPSSVRTANASLMHPGMDGDASLHSSASFPSASSSPPRRRSAPVCGRRHHRLGALPPLLPNPYIMAPGLLHAYPPQVYGYDDLQMLQTRIPLDYYSIPFAAPTAALTGRDGGLTNNPYSGDLSKFGRADASSPAPATTLAQSQQNQNQTHHTAQQTFLNPGLPPGYSYTSLPYYTGMPGLPNTFQYGPAMFPVAPTSSKQHAINVGVNASATPFQQASGYGSHGYSTGYEDVGQASGTGDFCKGGYGAVAAAAAAAAAASAQIKPATSVTGPGVGVSVTSSNTGVPDISGSVYTKTQSFDKQGFHAGTPTASFSLPSALGSGGPINAPAPAGYPPAPFMHILAPHQQPHSQIMHHHLQQDAQTGTGQRNQNASIQQKAQINKSAYNSYNWGGN
ncbi:LOW QUALITY PROTEIN: hypothetical protein CRUP_014092 [Coryphaenoides rupestris]|nr:LOW QUALITY PROTEIN: hypothetical protein CRUP_014092 [Coryphaenoides rupestris]